MKPIRSAFILSGLLLVFYSAGAAAQLTSQGMLDQVVIEFANRASSWQTVVMRAALWLFWTLGTISLVWTFGMMALRKADTSEFFAEFVHFILFFGFFLWLLRNGPAFAFSIIQSLQQIGEQASGVSSVTPSGIVDIGFMVWKQAISNLSLLSPVDSFVGIVLSAGILLLLAAVAVNILMIWVSGWILMYAGIFFLGFGGSRWTSDIAINYYKTVLGIAIQLMAIVLLVGIGNDLLSSFYAKMNKGALNFEELGIMLVFCFALLMLVNKIPSLASGIISGAGIGHSGIGNLSAGAVAGMAMGATSMAASAAGMASTVAMDGVQNISGGVSALQAAFSKAGESMQSGAETFSSSSWSGDANDSSSSSSAGGYAQAASHAENSTANRDASATSSKNERGNRNSGRTSGNSEQQLKTGGGEFRQTASSCHGRSASTARNTERHSAAGGIFALAAQVAATEGRYSGNVGITPSLAENSLSGETPVDSESETRHL